MLAMRSTQPHLPATRLEKSVAWATTASLEVVVLSLVIVVASVAVLCVDTAAVEDPRVVKAVLDRSPEQPAKKVPVSNTSRNRPNAAGSARHLSSGELRFGAA